MVPDRTLMLILGMVGLMFLAAISAIALRRLRFPYTIGLVLVGLILGAVAVRVPALAPLRHLQLTPNLILYVLLPTLLFDAAVNMESRLLFQNITPVMVMAAPGLIVATAITGALVAALTPLTLGPAMLFGALISTTDPVAAIALFKEIGAPRRLTMLVDGESLFNDATAIVAFQVVLGVIAGGAWSAVVLAKAGLSFVAVFLGGTLVGAVIGYLMVFAIRLAGDDPLIQIALTTVVAYAAFIAANYFLQISGVMAVVGAGLVIGWYGSTRFSPEVRQYLRQFWSFASFAANSFIFLLLGLTETFLMRDYRKEVPLSGYILAAVFAILAARAVVVLGLCPLLNRMRGAERIDLRNQAVMIWGGLRGALPIGLAISLPPDFPGRSLIVELTLGVVLFSLLVQGTTMRPLIRGLGLARLSIPDRLARLQAVRVSKQEALRRVEEMNGRWDFLPPVLEAVRQTYAGDIASADRNLADLRRASEAEQEARHNMLWSEVITLTHTVFRMLFERGFLSEALLREFENGLEILRDGAERGRLALERLADRPMGARLRRLSAHALEHDAPRTRLFRRCEAKAFQTAFELNVAMVVAANRVLESLDRLAGLCGAEAGDVDECRRFHEDQRRQAVDRLKDMGKRFPGMMRQVQERTLRRAALDAERDAVGEMVRAGGISERLAADLQGEIQQALKGVAGDAS